MDGIDAGNAESVGIWPARIALLGASAALSFLLLLGLGAVPGFLLGAGAWALSYRTLRRAPSGGGPARSTARAAIYLAAAAVLLHGLVLILMIANILS